MPATVDDLPALLANAEQLFPLTKAAVHAKWLPPRINPSTLLRWALRGNLARDGRRVRLEALRAGGVWMTSEAALKRFFTTLTEPATAVVPAPPSVRQRRAEQAAARLARRGV